MSMRRGWYGEDNWIWRLESEESSHILRNKGTRKEMASRNTSFVYLGVPLSRHQLGATQHTVVSLFFQSFSLALKSHDQLKASSFFFLFLFSTKGWIYLVEGLLSMGLSRLVLNLEGHLNRWIGSKFKAILLNGCFCRLVELHREGSALQPAQQAVFFF